MPERNGNFAFRILAVTGTALVLMFFSEFYFLNEGPAAALAQGISALPGLASFLGAYGIFAWLFLILLDRFRVHDLAGLVLAGAIFGWATEALVVPVVYEGPPVTFFFPPVGWHALVDVVAGWYLLRLAMRRWPVWMLAGLFALIGVTWAFWATWTWGDGDAFTTGQFRNIVLVSSGLWGVGLVLADLGAARRFHASRTEVLLLPGAALVLFVATGLPFWPWMLALSALMALTLFALWRGAGNDGRASLAGPMRMPPLSAYLALPILPAAALLAYPLILESRWAVPSAGIVLLLTFAGGAVFFWAIVKMFTSR